MRQLYISNMKYIHLQDETFHWSLANNMCTNTIPIANSLIQWHFPNKKAKHCTISIVLMRLHWLEAKFVPIINVMGSIIEKKLK